MLCGRGKSGKNIKEGVADSVPHPDDIQTNHVTLNKSLLLPGPELPHFLNWVGRDKHSVSLPLRRLTYQTWLPVGLAALRAVSMPWRSTSGRLSCPLSPKPHSSERHLPSGLGTQVPEGGRRPGPGSCVPLHLRRISCSCSICVLHVCLFAFSGSLPASHPDFQQHHTQPVPASRASLQMSLSLLVLLLMPRLSLVVSSSQSLFAFPSMSDSLF